MTCDSVLLPRDDGILAAGLFSVLLHLPLLVGVGVYFGGEQTRPLSDITAIIESAAGAMRPLEAAEIVPAPQIDERGRIPRRRVPARPPLSRFPVLPVLERRTLLDEGLEGVPTPLSVSGVSLAALCSPGGRASRQWVAWYTGEVRKRISDAFPCRPLLKNGIRGKVRFRIHLRPDGSVERFEVLQAERHELIGAARLAVKRAAPFPGYGSLGLDFFPPFDLTVNVVR